MHQFFFCFCFFFLFGGGGGGVSYFKVGLFSEGLIGNFMVHWSITEGVC